MDFDRAVLKKRVLELWSGFQGDTLVKVMPLGANSIEGKNIGYCSSIKFIIGRTPTEMEAVLGLRARTKLQKGAEIYAVWPLPEPDGFDLKGYTNTPAGISTSVMKPNPDDPPGLGAPKWDLARVDQARHLIKLATVPAEVRFRYNISNLSAQTLPSLAR